MGDLWHTRGGGKELIELAEISYQPQASTGVLLAHAEDVRWNLSDVPAVLTVGRLPPSGFHVFLYEFVKFAAAVGGESKVAAAGIHPGWRQGSICRRGSVDLEAEGLLRGVRQRGLTRAKPAELQRDLRAEWEGDGPLGNQLFE